MTKEQKIIFVCGLHRSGTTLFAKMIGRNHRIASVTDAGINDIEGQYLQTVYPIEAYYGGPGRMGFNAAAHLTEESPLVTEGNRQRLVEEWGRFLNPDCDFFVEKTPANLLKTRFLQALFPDAYFIVLTRHPIAVALATQKWAGTGLFSLIEHWIACHEIFERDKSHLRRVLTLKYEELTANHQTVIARIADFLDIEPWDPEFRPRSDVNARYFARWQRIVEAYENDFEDQDDLLTEFQVRSRALCERHQRGEIGSTEFSKELRQAEELIWRSTHIKGEPTKRPQRTVGRLLRRRTEGWFDKPGFQIVDAGAEARDAVARFEKRVVRLGYSLNI